jgi:hypothetical protein
LRRTGQVVSKRPALHLMQNNRKQQHKELKVSTEKIVCKQLCSTRKDTPQAHAVLMHNHHQQQQMQISLSLSCCPRCWVQVEWL